ncbi:MAG: sugar ABC transporter substrate-binding protein [Planctomycetaceae bacterium]|nr:sugar ABC transporter substrate-binding protein [Planctomycetaceae bacterium]
MRTFASRAARVLAILALVVFLLPVSVFAGQYKIGYVSKNLNDDFMISLKEGAEEHAAKLGVELYYMTANNNTDIEKQIQLADDMITLGVDALILVPMEPASLIPTIIKANEADIPVILVNDPIDDEAAKEQGATYVTYVGTDNVMGGKVAAEYVKKNYPNSAKVALIGGVAGQTTSDQRLDGFKLGIKDQPNIEVVAEQPTDWSRDQGFNVMQNMLTANPHIDLVFGASDVMIMGASEAIIQADMQDKIKALGFDGSAEALEMVKNGDMLGTVAQYPTIMSSTALDAAIDTLNGKTVPNPIYTHLEVLTKETIK